jgi:hypothetical protein
MGLTSTTLLDGQGLLAAVIWYWYWYESIANTNIKKSIRNTNTNFSAVLQYLGNTEESIGNTRNTNTILQY